MQLSAPTTSPDLILATLGAPAPGLDGLLPTATSQPGEAVLPATATVGDAAGFAELFPTLSSAAPAAGAVVPTTGAPAQSPGDVIMGAFGAVEDCASEAPATPAVAKRGEARLPSAARSARHQAADRDAAAEGFVVEAPLHVASMPADPVLVCPAQFSTPPVLPVCRELESSSDGPESPDGGERLLSADGRAPVWIAGDVVRSASSRAVVGGEGTGVPIIRAAAESVRPASSLESAPVAGTSALPPMGEDSPVRAAQVSSPSFLRVPPTMDEVRPLPPLAPALQAAPETLAIQPPPMAQMQVQTLIPRANSPLPTESLPASESAAAGIASSSAPDEVTHAVTMFAGGEDFPGGFRPAGAGRATIPESHEVRGENIAAFVARNLSPVISPREPSLKTFLSAADESVTRSEPVLGIGVAKPTPTMPALVFDHHPAPEAVLADAAQTHSLVAVADSTARLEFPSAVNAPAVAHRAVEAVLNAAESFSAGSRRSVNLEFSVGGADLAVRVELHADEVRATFRTDSAELRAALAHEWRLVGADSPERPFRLAPPVFAANTPGDSSLASFAGDGAPRHRDPHPRRTAGEVFASIVSRGRAVSIPDEIALPTGRIGSLPTSLHLHTVA